MTIATGQWLYLTGLLVILFLLLTGLHARLGAVEQKLDALLARTSEAPR